MKSYVGRPRARCSGSNIYAALGLEPTADGHRRVLAVVRQLTG